jgi:hypothetical protein
MIKDLPTNISTAKEKAREDEVAKDFERLLYVNLKRINKK